MVTGIDLNSKWNDHEGDLYLWNGKTLFKIAEGDGSNLWAEDEEQGYVDYWVTYIASKEFGDGGMWMETELISQKDYTIQGVIDRLMECDLWDDEWKVIDEELGEILYEAFEKYWKVERVMKYLIEKVNK